MPQIKDYHEGIPYHKISKGKDKGCYQLHRPSQCWHKFPTTNTLVHKCEVRRKSYYRFPNSDNSIRKHIKTNKEPNFYPAVLHISEYQRILEQAKRPTTEEQIAELHKQEAAAQKLAAESEARKTELKRALKPQPREDAIAASANIINVDAPDHDAHTLVRANYLRAQQMYGPRTCRSLILASKCHAIRDAQLLEKELLKKEREDESRRLDALIERMRVESIERKHGREKRRHELSLENLTALKEQIIGRELGKKLEMERIEEVSIRVNQANLAMQEAEMRKLHEKHERQAKLKKMLDEGSEELLRHRQQQMEEDRITNKRINDFLQQKFERETRNKEKADAIKAAKLAEIANISSAQKAEQDMKDETERIRNLKIQEDVERDYRRKELEAAIKRNQDMKDLHAAREKQIHDIYHDIAYEIVKDENNFDMAARQNEEDLKKEKEMNNKHKAEVERHRQEIMKQINDNERARANLRETTQNQGVAVRLEQDRQHQYELATIKRMVGEMREQKIEEKYVKEVEQILQKHGLHQN